MIEKSYLQEIILEGVRWGLRVSVRMWVGEMWEWSKV
jgi:hypothetical protein